MFKTQLNGSAGDVGTIGARHADITAAPYYQFKRDINGGHREVKCDDSMWNETEAQREKFVHAEVHA